MRLRDHSTQHLHRTIGAQIQQEKYNELKLLPQNTMFLDYLKQKVHYRR